MTTTDPTRSPHHPPANPRHPEEAATFLELVAAAIVRAVEVAAFVLLALLVCPPLFILVVVVVVPLVALGAVLALAVGIALIPIEVTRRLRGRRAHHTFLVASGLRRLRGARA